jgi:hypothetical protein
VGHPFFLIPITVAAVTRSLFWSAVVAASTSVPLLAIIIRNVRRGAWSDVDVSRHDQRSGVYYAGFPLLLVTAILLYLLGASAELMRGIAAGAVMFAAGLAGNRFLKISMHMMFAAFCTVALVRGYPAAAFGAIPFVAAIAWSRHYLSRHTWPEIATGLVIGALCGAAGS